MNEPERSSRPPVVTRADELLMHDKVMGKCCHVDAKTFVREGACRTITMRCDACGAALSWHAKRRKDEKPSDSPSTVLQRQIPRYAGNRLIADEVVRRLQRLGWLCTVVTRVDKQVCIAERGEIQVEGLPSREYSDAVCSVALKLAQSGALSGSL
ncbi:MAG: hypothetical protein EPO20_06390 [Betaproteobacteria bacterium]|nr:MAG: hypothetical protein EPO20_06390 [Betaproteobacteria bacterium]